MAPQSRGQPVPVGFISKSTPDLPRWASREDAPVTSTKAVPARGLLPQDLLTEDTSNAQSATPSAASDGLLDGKGTPRETVDTTSTSRISSSSSSSTSDSDSTPISNLPHASSLYSLHSRSHTYLGPAAFAPPFYNRPPTPLPPSPSLTSLLRPSFSAAPSRRASPDHSSDEASNNPAVNTGTAGGSAIRASSSLGARGISSTRSATAVSTLTSSYRTARPVPLASPKVPTYEYYGFTLYLGSSLAFLMYLLWAFLPSPFLHQLGIYYYPNRWWALAVPAWLVMGVVWIYVALAGWNTEFETLALGDLRTVVDEKGQVAVEAKMKAARRGKGGGSGGGGGTVKGRAGSERKDLVTLWSEGTDAVMDIPISGVCEVLYGAESEAEDDGLDEA